MTQATLSPDLQSSADRRYKILLAATAVVGFAVTVSLGVALHANTVGAPLDRWFQRLAVGLSAHPGSPGFHYRSYWLLTRTLALGHPPGVLVVAGLAGVVMATTASTTRSRVVNGLAPFVAVVLAGSATEWVIKNLVDRRMVGNLSVATYPSAHAVGTAAVAGCVLFSLARCRISGASVWRRALLRRSVSTAFILLSLGIGLDMAILRSHFLTDVIGGWTLGAAVAALTCLATFRLSSPRQRR